MKVFMIFIALLIINTSFMTYHCDLNNYTKLQAYMKALAEDAAAGAALYYDEEAYGNGIMIINKIEGEKFISDLLTQADTRLGLVGNESLSFDFDIVDHRGEENLILPPSVTVTIKFTGRELFRLPFLNHNLLVRSARYELAGY